MTVEPILADNCLDSDSLIPVILVVDDHPENVELLETYLIPQGYEIVKAANGEEALEKLSGQHIDLILLDVMMPGVDGFEVTRRIRQDDTQRLLPIILVALIAGNGGSPKGNRRHFEEI